jgi:hypothetical protein
MKGVRILPVLLWGVAACAQLRPGMLESLVRDSPFRPPQGGAAPAEGSPGQFEFRGVVVEAGGYSFCIYDQGRHAADWVKLDEPGRPFVARRYDPAKDTLTIELSGQALTLALKRAQVQALTPPPPVASPPPPLPVNGAPASGPAAGSVPPPPAANAAEAQRLQNIADEIRRRRGVRQMPPAENPPRKP